MILASLLGKFSSPGLRGGKPVSFSGRGGLVDFKKKTSVHPTPRCVIDAAEDRGRDATSVLPATTPSCAVWPTAGVIHRARAGAGPREGRRRGRRRVHRRWSALRADSTSLASVGGVGEYPRRGG